MYAGTLHIQWTLVTPRRHGNTQSPLQQTHCPSNIHGCSQNTRSFSSSSITSLYFSRSFFQTNCRCLLLSSIYKEPLDHSPYRHYNIAEREHVLPNDSSATSAITLSRGTDCRPHSWRGYSVQLTRGIDRRNYEWCAHTALFKLFI
jgi:hypothetical protein